MLETIATLPVAHQAYLAMAIAAFCTFGVTLGVVSTWSNLKK